MKKGKEFIFPENVNKDFGVWHGFTLKDIMILLSVLAIGLLLFFIPPYKSIIWLFIKIVIVAVAMTFVMAILSVRPIKSRRNIKVSDIYKIRKKYRSSQKLYFIAPQKKEVIQNGKREKQSRMDI